MENDKQLKFINTSNIVHNNFYDYSLVQYSTTYTLVKIICPIHGVFEQLPKYHIKGSGCKRCATIHRQQTNLQKYGHRNAAHGIGRQDQIRKTCMLKYGVEWAIQSSEVLEKQTQTNLHLYNVKHIVQMQKTIDSRMTKCLDLYGVDNPFKSHKLQEIIKQNNIEKYGVEYPLQSLDIRTAISDKKHLKYGDRYYNNSTKTKITNLKKYGCHPNQHHMVDSLQLITNPNWLFDQYINQNKSAIQIADELGVWDTTVGNYLRKYEIEIKLTTNYSYKSIQWLDSIQEQEGINIQHALNGGEYQIPGTRYKADGYCHKTNTIYEFHGDYWHGNPQLYAPDVINEVNDKSMGELYQKTIEREEQIRSMGYNLVVIWENQLEVV